MSFVVLRGEDFCSGIGCAASYRRLVCKTLVVTWKRISNDMSPSVINLRDIDV